MALRLLEVLSECLLEFPVGGRIGHRRQRLQELTLSAAQIAKLSGVDILDCGEPHLGVL